MTLKAFTDNFADNATEAGFPFTFIGNYCNEGYKPQLAPWTTCETGKFLTWFGKAAGAATQIAGTYRKGRGDPHGDVRHWRAVPRDEPAVAERERGPFLERAREGQGEPRSVPRVHTASVPQRPERTVGAAR